MPMISSPSGPVGGDDGARFGRADIEPATVSCFIAPSHLSP